MKIQFDILHLILSSVALYFYYQLYCLKQEIKRTREHIEQFLKEIHELRELIQSNNDTIISLKSQLDSQSNDVAVKIPSLVTDSVYGSSDTIKYILIIIIIILL